MNGGQKVIYVMIRLNGKHIYGHSEYSVPIRISLCLSTKVIRVETQVVGVGNGLCVVYRRFATGILMDLTVIRIPLSPLVISTDLF